MLNDSSENLRQFSQRTAAGDPGFERILAFEFYDGPERGLALYPSGCGARFSSLGDSASRLLRAFEIVSIEGSWRVRLEALQSAADAASPRRVLLPTESSDALAQLERDIASAPRMDFFVGVGSSYFEKMSIVPVNEEQLINLRQVGASPEGFRAAHRLIKKIREQND